MHTTNPETATADGISLAYLAGAEICDLEFVQFHPTVFFKDDKAFLISEAVRGEGAFLVNESGERFMTAYHPLGELGPRDIVARALIQEKNKTSGNVYLDIRHLDAGFIRERFPTIYSTCLDWGLDITSEKIPVCPAAHYFIGGIRVDSEGKTRVKGLFAVGEAAHTGVHGANRLASNSLLEALVFSKRVSDYLSNNTDPQKLKPEMAVRKETGNTTGEDPAVIKNSLRKLMWEKVGLFRTEKTLKEAISQLEDWMSFFSYMTFNPEERELQSMLLVSRMLAGAALHRCESLGCHFRNDYPETSSGEKYRLVFRKEKELTGVEINCS